MSTFLSPLEEVILEKTKYEKLLRFLVESISKGRPYYCSGKIDLSSLLENYHEFEWYIFLFNSFGRDTGRISYSLAELITYTRVFFELEQVNRLSEIDPEVIVEWWMYSIIKDSGRKEFKMLRKYCREDLVLRKSESSSEDNDYFLGLLRENE